jgi:hypothetical protein
VGLGYYAMVEGLGFGVALLNEPAGNVCNDGGLHCSRGKLHEQAVVAFPLHAVPLRLCALHWVCFQLLPWWLFEHNALGVGDWRCSETV